MFIEIESSGRHSRLINVTLADKVQLDDAAGTATLWTGGVILAADSRMLYDFYRNRPDELVAQPKAKIQTGIATPAKEG